MKYIRQILGDEVSVRPMGVDEIASKEKLKLPFSRPAGGNVYTGAGKVDISEGMIVWTINDWNKFVILYITVIE